MLWKGGGEVSSLSKIVLIKIKRILYDLLGELKQFDMIFIEWELK